MRYKGVIFDMDGVLFDTERLYQITWHELAAERNIELGESFLYEISGTSGAQSEMVVKKHFQVSEGIGIVKECKARMQEKLAVHVPLKEGVHEILSFLKEKGILITVASSTTIPLLEKNLTVGGIRDYFDIITSGDEVVNSKPAPDIFVLAANKIGCRPEECLVIEDSENGIKAGHAAGCGTIMVPDMIEATPEIRAYCTKVCRSLLEAKEEINKFLLDEK